MGRQAERLRRVCQDADLALEIVLVKGRGHQGVNDGETQLPVLRYMSISYAMVAEASITPMTMIRSVAMMPS
jgi:hypothetical protein